MEAKRKVFDCRLFPSEKQCTVTIIGKEEEVLPLAIHHAVHDHGEKDTPELLAGLKALLRDE